MKILRFPLIPILVVLAGCSTTAPSQPAPEQVQPPITEKHQQVVQKKALAAQHWGAVAADVAARTKATLASNNFLDGRTLYLAPASQSAFDQAFSNFMITALVEAGLPVSTQKEGAVELKYDTQVIQHQVQFDPRKQGYVPGAPGQVEVDFWVMRNLRQEALPESAARVDASSPEHLWPTSVEMVITTTIVDMDQYLQRTTDAYYIEQADLELFKPKAIQRNYKDWGVVSK